MNISSVFLLNMKQCLWPRALACTLMFLGPLTLCVSVNAAGLTITSPRAGVVLNNRVSVTVNGTYLTLGGWPYLRILL